MVIHRLALSSGKRFVSPSSYDPSYPTALAVWCSDGRFTKAVEDLLCGDGETRFDTLTLPGGPALFTGRSASPSDLDTTTTSAEFLISAHKITHVVRSPTRTAATTAGSSGMRPQTRRSRRGRRLTSASQQRRSGGCTLASRSTDGMRTWLPAESHSTRWRSEESA